jgi:hypothetical protein
MNNQAPTSDPLIEAERRIEWILASPGSSGWLKNAPRGAFFGDPVDPVVLLNDLELLGHILHQ